MKLTTIILSLLLALPATAEPLAFGWNLNDRAAPPVKAHKHTVHTRVAPRPWHNGTFSLEYEENRLQGVLGVTRAGEDDHTGSKALRIANKAVEGFTARFGPPQLVNIRLDESADFWTCMADEVCGEYLVGWNVDGFSAFVMIRGKHKGVGVTIKKKD